MTPNSAQNGGLYPAPKRLLGGAGGFSLVECIIALVVLMVGALSIVSVFHYSFKNNVNARKRFAALLLAQQRLEDMRNMAFADLPVGNTIDYNVMSDGLSYKVVRTITNNDLLTVTTAPGPETRQITITVSPMESDLVIDQVVLTTFRAVNRPGPNRKDNDAP